jgi:hypothetical protein
MNVQTVSCKLTSASFDKSQATSPKEIAIVVVVRGTVGGDDGKSLIVGLTLGTPDGNSLKEDDGFSDNDKDGTVEGRLLVVGENVAVG